jgi:hypothetical protein
MSYYFAEHSLWHTGTVWKTILIFSTACSHAFLKCIQLTMLWSSSSVTTEKLTSFVAAQPMIWLYYWNSRITFIPYRQQIWPNWKLYERVKKMIMMIMLSYLNFLFKVLLLLDLKLCYFNSQDHWIKQNKGNTVYLHLINNKQLHLVRGLYSWTKVYPF